MLSAMTDADSSTPPLDGPIHHLAMPDDWAAAFDTGEYRMSTRGLTIDDVGFIHCSTRSQVESTANRFYGDLDRLVLLTIDPAVVDAPIRFEPPEPGSDELFPHIYGPLPISAVVDAAFWMRSSAAWSLD
jgi:glutathione S-transferase